MSGCTDMVSNCSADPQLIERVPNDSSHRMHRIHHTDGYRYMVQIELIKSFRLDRSIDRKAMILGQAYAVL